MTTSVTCDGKFASALLHLRLLRLLERNGLTAPLVEVAPPWSQPVASRLDCLYLDARVVVEGRRPPVAHAHGGLPARSGPDNDAAAHGYRTLRITWFDVTKRPAMLVARIRAAIVPSEMSGNVIPDGGLG